MAPLNPYQVKYYLHHNIEASFKWNSFIEGAWNLTPKMIKNMNAPELSVLAYALNKRYKAKADLLIPHSGGKTISG